MHCNPLTDPACVAGHLIKSITGGVTGDVLGGIAQAINSGVEWVVTNTATWWVRIPSPDLAAEPAVTRIQQWLLPIAAAIAVGAVIAAGARMALTRRANPLLDVTGGLLTIAAAGTLGVTAASLLLKAGDAWSAWALQVATGGHFAQRLNLMLQLGGAAAPAVVLVFGLLAIVLSLVQAILMLLRQAALLILAGVLPLAAAGSIAPMTRTWVRKVTAWMLALICYKPAAAAVYATAFTMVGSGRSPRTVLMGFVMMLLSVLMLPALLKFFTWTTGSIGSPSGGAGQLFGAATVGAIAVGAMRSGPTAAQGQAAHLDSSLGTPPPASGGDTPPGGPAPRPGGGGGGGGADPGTGPAGSGAASPSGPLIWPNATAGGAWSPWAGAGSGAEGPAMAGGHAEGGANAASAAPTAAGATAGGTAASGAASGAGAAATMAAESARSAARTGHLAAGAMDAEDQS
jgi:hypothetical protein